MNEKLDKLLTLKEELVVAEINASSCRTERDWQKVHELQTKFDNAYEEFVSNEFSKTNI